MKLGVLGASCCAVVLLCLPARALAQRELHWDSVEVDATLDAAGMLRIAETQTMVFTGDWNGGERRFDVRPRKKLSLISLSRSEGGRWIEMTEDSSLDDVGDYAWTDPNTLRWRSRTSTDPPFANTQLRYLLRYQMSGILLKEDNDYRLNHDFVFPDRDGNINRFQLRLTLDSAWQPLSDVPEVYAAERLAPGEGFIVTLPLRHMGATAPMALDSRRPPEIVMAVLFLLSAMTVGVVALLAREQSYGRFAPLARDIDEAWLREHVLKYPAEVVGAAWDEGISTPEVVALIARMVSEGKLESTVSKSGSMTLQLKVDRTTLEGHERTLVERLFFDGRTQTSTTLVKEHYKNKGFDPADEIRRELESRVEAVLPAGAKPRRMQFASSALFIVGVALLGVELFAGRLQPGGAVGTVIGSLVLIGIAWGVGTGFRANIHWGHKAALASLSPSIMTILGVAIFLWFVAGPGIVEASTMLVLAVVALALAVLFSSIDSMKSRQQRAAIAFRKRLAAGRAFFISELQKEQPTLRDEWFPWILAFGLATRMDDWSAKHAPGRRSTRGSSATSLSSGAGSSSTPQWSGFGGGRSGGAGGGAAWVTAASGLAAGVSSPSSSGSSGGGSSSGSSSSGGGGGGGW